MRRVGALCRRSVAAARHLGAQHYVVLALYLHAFTVPRCYEALVAHHSDVAIFHRCNIAQLQICDAVAFRRLNAVIL